jgi:integrase
MTVMGHAKPRVAVTGKTRWTAVYVDLHGRERSAGTYNSKREAARAWARAEADAAAGHSIDMRRAKTTFTGYVTNTWLPHHELEATTRQRYGYQIERHLIPEFGPMRLSRITTQHVREWITKLKDDGLSASTIADLKTILSAIFTTALNDQLIGFHPCRGVKTPTVARRPRTIITPDQFDTILAALPSARWQAMVELDIESGLRWGELTELRVRDLNTTTRMLTIARAVVEISPRHRAAGAARFQVKNYPKDREYRRVKLSVPIAQILATHITDRNLDSDDLLFAFPDPEPGHETRPLTSLPPPVGKTEPNAAGRTYPHATITGYNLGRCRCPHCRAAFAAYRARRRGEGRDDPRTAGRTVDTDGHLPRRWFLTTIWHPTLKTAGLDIGVRVHDLRHAHASWLLAGGADIQTVKERLGHSSLRTTEKYLHTLPDTDDTALDALHRTRERRA